MSAFAHGKLCQILIVIIIIYGFYVNLIFINIGMSKKFKENVIFFELPEI
jgi:hypothetical protein